MYPELLWLNSEGHQLWYDEGISAGEEWTNSIADSILGCSTFLYFVSPAAVFSEHCRRELNFALSHNIPILCVHLMETTVERGLELSLGNRQAILRYKLPEERYRKKLIAALALESLAEVRQPMTSRWARRKAAGVGVLVFAVLLMSVMWFLPESAPVNKSSSTLIDIGVLPVSDLSNPSQPKFSEALTLEILARLAGVSEWQSHIIDDRDSAAMDYLVKTSVRLQEEMVRLSVDIRVAKTGAVLDSFTTDDVRQVDVVTQQRLSMLVGHIVHETLGFERMRRETLNRTGSTEAVEVLLAPRRQENRTIMDPAACIRAAELDSALVPAQVCLARLLLLSINPEQVQAGKSLVDKLLAQDVSSSELLAAAALYPLHTLRDYRTAEQLLIESLELNPFSGEAMASQAWLLFVTGRLDEAIDTFQMLMPLLRTSDPLLSMIVAYQYNIAAWTAQRFDVITNEQELGNSFVSKNELLLALNYAEMDDPRALPLIERADLRWLDLKPRQRSMLTLALQRVGKTARAAERHAEIVATIEAGKYFLPQRSDTWLGWGLTHYAVSIGDYDSAFRWLKLSRSNERDLVLLVASFAYTLNPRYAGLRDDPRFAAVFAEMRRPVMPI